MMAYSDTVEAYDTKVGTLFILINTSSLISGPLHFLGGKGDKIPPKLALGQENIIFLP